MCLSLFSEAYNRYIEVIGRSIGAGACANAKRENRVPEIKVDTPVFRLLSSGDNDDESELDFLYLVINDIVSVNIVLYQSEVLLCSGNIP